MTNTLMSNPKSSTRILFGAITLALITPWSLFAQTDVAPADEEVYELSPFEVSGAGDIGYLATSSLAGTRIRTDLADIGSAVSVYTEEFMSDLMAVDTETLLSYGLGTEVGGVRGNFINANSFGIENDNLESPHTNTRVRGLTSADNTVNYYRTDVPWDGYNINRVDIQRGANSILFGLGSPAGIINATTIDAEFTTRGQFQVRIDEYGSVRLNLDYNHELLEDELAVRVALLKDDQKFKQKPAFEDDHRVFGAVNYSPAPLNRDGMLFNFKAHYEGGSVESNRPRWVAPIDTITPWVESGNGFNGMFLVDDPRAVYQNGRVFDQINENGVQTVQRTYSNGWIGTTFGGNSPRYIYDFAAGGFVAIEENTLNSRGSWYFDTEMEDAGMTQAVRNLGLVDTGGLNLGEINDNIRGVQRFRVNGKNRAAADLAVPFQGFWKDSSFTDTRYFDFYNKLVDGDGKREDKDWDMYELELTNTFMDNKFGYNVGFFKQVYSSRFDALLGNVFAPTITVDTGLWYVSATPERQDLNPYTGRAYVVGDNNGGRITKSTRESLRLQGFFSHDFTEQSDSILMEILGKHDLVGVAQNRQLDRRGRNYTLTGVGRDWLFNRADVLPDADTPPPGSRLAEYGRNLDAPSPFMNFYLTSSGDGITGLGNVDMSLNDLPSGLYPVAGFDANPLFGFGPYEAAMETWLDPWAEDPKEAEFNNEPEIPVVYNYQADNPDNYFGWRESIGDYRFFNAYNSEQEMEYLTRQRTVFTEDVDSIAAVWTGRWLDGGIVGMFGWRRDEATETWLEHDYRDDGPNFDPSEENRSSRETEVESRNWSIKGNLTYLVGLREELPFDLHLLYSEGEVQTPDPTRIDVFGRTLPNSEGNTEDISFMITTDDQRFSLRVTKYETVVKDAVSTANVNREKWRLEQVLSQGTFRAGLIETDAQNYTADWLTLSQSAINAGYDNEADYRREVMAPAWREFEAGLFNNFPLTRGWYLTEFQPGDQTAPQVRFPDNATLVEDQQSEGWEIEFTANPTKDWRISIAVSQTDAIRDNLPGDEFGAVVDYVVEAMRGPAGEIPIWWFAGPGVGTWLDPLVGELVTARALNGASQPEIREWKGTLVTNYSFTEGRLAGLGLGGAWRYEDSAIYAYDPIILDDGNLGIDLNSSYADDERHTVDLWLSYRRKIADSVDWRIQLNVFNVFGEDELVPLARNPDGTFGHMGIREGTSWAIVNTFDF